MKTSPRSDLALVQQVKLPRSLQEKIKAAKGADFEIDGWNCKAITYSDGLLYRVKFKKWTDEDDSEEFWVELDDTGWILEIRYTYKGDYFTIDNQGGVFQWYEWRKSMRFNHELKALYSGAWILKVMEETWDRKIGTQFDINLSPTGFQEGHNTTGSYLYIHFWLSSDWCLEPRWFSAGSLVEDNFQILFQSAAHSIDEQKKQEWLIVRDAKKIPILARYGVRDIEISINGAVLGRYRIDDVVPVSLAQMLEMQPPKSSIIQAQWLVLETWRLVEEIKPSV